MLLLALSLLLPQSDPILSQYTIKVEDKIAFFGLGASELYKFENPEFRLVNTGLFPFGNFDIAGDRPVAIGNLVYVPQINSNIPGKVGTIDILKIVGSDSIILNSFQLQNNVTEIRIGKLQNTVICALNSIETRTLIFFEVGGNGQRFIDIVDYNEFGVSELFLSRVIVIDQNNTKYIYILAYKGFPNPKAIIYNLNHRSIKILSGFSRNDDTIPYSFNPYYKSKWGTSDRLYLQRNMASYGQPYTTEVIEFAPVYPPDPLFLVETHKIPSNLGFLGDGGGDFDGDGREEFVITGVAPDNERLYITQLGPLDMYVQVFNLIDDYKWLNDAVAGDFNGDGKTDLVLLYGQELNYPKFKFLRGTKIMFQPSLIWK